MAAPVIKLKLVIDLKDDRVLFAEAGKDFVDFLFDVLSLPVAKLISLVQGPNHDMVGSLPKLFGGLQNLRLNGLLNMSHAVWPALGVSIPLLGIKDNIPAPRKLFFSCIASCSYNYVSDDRSTSCPGCGRLLTRMLSYVAPCNPVIIPAADRAVKYMVMDDLGVNPMSTSSWFTMMTTFDVKSVAALEERVVDLGMKEAVNLLRASLKTKNVLTSVFLSSDK